METKDILTNAIENLKEELRAKGRELAEEMVENIGTLRDQAEVIAQYQQKYEDGYITLDELVNTHEAMVKILPSLLLDSTYVKTKQSFKELDAKITKFQNFINTL